MHTVLITFDCAASVDALTQAFTDDAAALQQQPGLASEVWITADTGYGGFHVIDRVSRSDGHRHVLDQLSATTGISPVAA